jgi:ethanolamine ammonia-lyase large subunit
VLGLKPALDFEAWLARMGMLDAAGRLAQPTPSNPLLVAFPGPGT